MSRPARARGDRDRTDAMSALYDNGLLHLDRWDVPTLVFDEGMPGDDPRPRWPRSTRRLPAARMHLDIRVGDLDAVDALVVNRDATAVARFDDHRVYADIIGHPFCLYRGVAKRSYGGS